MKVAVFSTKPYDETYLTRANQAGHELMFFESALKRKNASLAEGYEGVCIFVNDQADAEVLDRLHKAGVRLIALRCAGFNNVDLKHAEKLGMTVVRVPSYSPYAVAEHAVMLMLSLNRHVHRAYNRVRERNFALEGLVGFDMHGKTVGIVGTGKIGQVLAHILKGFGCHLLAHDPYQVDGLPVEYVDLPELYSRSDIISLHCPLTPDSHHMINADTMNQMKPGVMLINTSRGGLIDTAAVTEGLKSGQIGYLGLDVYEEEGDLFFEDLSNEIIQDDVFSRLLTFPNVIITGHQAFFTDTALTNIADTTLDNISRYEQGQPIPNALTCQKVSASK